MKKSLITRGVASAIALALSMGINTLPATAADKEVLVWADEKRGPNLSEVLKKKSNWVPGYTIKVRSFSSFDAMKDAWDKSTELTGPDIILGANSWVPEGAKNGKLAPITLTSSVKSRFSANNLFDLTYKNKLYGIPLDINAVGMIYNEDLVKKQPTSFGEMVNFYKANKTKLGL
jgi:maltose-binding protein MalE